MELSEHFQELRSRLFICLGCFTVVAAGAFYLFPYLWPVIQYPLCHSEFVTLVNLSPAEGISVNLLVACLMAALVCSPIFLYHAYAFCVPAVPEARKRTFLFSVLTASLLFFAGAAFAYFLAIPFLFSFLSRYSDSAVQMWSQTSYVSFLFRFEMLFALIFQMPVVAAFLGRTGIFDKSFLQRHFRIVVFLTALFAAIVTPPDLLSLFWIAIPMLLLYGISLITYRLSWRAK